MFHEEALALYRHLGDQQGVAFALNNVGVQVLYQRDCERAGPFLEEYLAPYREMGDQRGIAVLLTNVGLGVLYQGDVCSFRPQPQRPRNAPGRGGSCFAGCWPGTPQATPE